MASSHRQTETLTWHTDVLPRATQRALAYLKTANWLKQTKWYLAGGTALALQAGHRSSVDLDFFTPQKDFSSGKLIGHFSAGVWATDILKEGTIYGRLHEAKVSFIAYPFFVPREPFKWYGQVRVLDPRDIAVMKIVAISQRGRKRDFLDLYWYCQNRERLGDVLSRLTDQYPTVAHNFHHIIKSLEYFDDAEADLMPELLFNITWTQIKKFFRQEVVKIARERLLK